MKKIYSLLFVCISAVTVAQSTFKVRVSDSFESLVGATAIVTGSDGATDKLVSDINGEFSTAIEIPFDVEIRFLGFETLTTTISKSGQIVIMKPSSTYLDDIVVTGQFNPQSARNSVYKVQTITSDRIASQNANSLHDILSNELNVKIDRDNATGRSEISLQGLRGQYVKVLIDGIPAVGKGGVRNDIDLAQFDVQSIERIEIVQGPMAVSYGSDALAGVINIITKKDIDAQLEVSVNIQTETAGSEYSFFDQGIHSPSINTSYKISDRWFTQLTGRYYRFGGWINEALINQPGEFDWHPKEQWFGGWLTRYETDRWELYYRLDILDERITNFGDLIVPANGGEPYKFDEQYNADRYFHQIQSLWRVSDFTTINSVFSYTDYERLSSNFRNFPLSGVEIPITSGNDTIYYRSFFSRNTINLISKKSGSFQVGVESTRETSGGSTLNDGDKHLTDLAIFASAELIFNDLKVRPGIRYSYNSLFESIPTASVNFAYKLGGNTNLRWSYGRGYRAPSIRELFHEFVDSNHNLIGNPDLKPEDSHNFTFNISHQLNSIPLSFQLLSFYNNINNGITILVPIGNEPTTYTNLTKMNTLGGNIQASYEQGRFTNSVGFSYVGRLQNLRDETGVPEYVFTPEIMSRASYRWSSINLSLSAFYKFNGSFRQYSLVEGEPRLASQESYHTLDLNLSKTFIKSIRIGIGARNILNVTTLNATGSTGGPHTAGSNIPVGFGRSYFLTINYQFKK